MGAFVVYTIKCFFCLAFFYLFNKLLLGRETFHTANRFFWLLLTPLSLLLPLGGTDGWLDLFSGSAAVSGMLVGNLSGASLTIPAAGPDMRMVFVFQLLLAVYFAGVLLFGLRMLYGYVGMIRMMVSGKKIGDTCRAEYSAAEKLAATLLDENKKAIGLQREVRILLQKESTTPFSWMNYIVIGETDLKENGAEILRHELFHIQKRHSLDVVLVDLLLIYQWFNPAAWLLKRSLQQVHEFQADDAVLRSGINAKHYQLLLIKKAVGQRLFSMSNSFNYSKLKNRIAMMLKKESSKWVYAKYLYILPLAFTFVSAYASEPITLKLNRVEESFVSQADTVTIKSQVVGSVNPVYVLNGKVISFQEFESIDVHVIQKIMVCKATLPSGSKTFLGVFDEQASKNGMVLILTKNGNAPKEFRDLVASGPNSEKADVVVKAPKNGDALRDSTQITFGKSGKSSSKIRLSGVVAGENPPLIIYDGKELASTKTISPNDIESITVLKDKSAVDTYGEKGKNGVIVIVSKEKSKKKE